MQEVWCKHFRVGNPLTHQVSQRGGATVIVVENNGTHHIGVAVCSKTDQFDRKKGRQVARARAMEAAVKGVKFNYPAERSGLGEKAVRAIHLYLPLEFLGK